MNVNQEDDTDAILFQQSLQEGRQDGRQAAEMASFKEGLQMGQVTGVDYGMEVGFARGLVEGVREMLVAEELADTEIETAENSTKEPAASQLSIESLSPHIRDASTLKRIQKSIEELEAAIQDFPNTEQLFAENSDDIDTAQQPQQQQQNSIREALQRIRARTKVLTAKLGMPHHSLKTVLNSKENAAATSGQEAGGTNEW